MCSRSAVEYVAQDVQLVDAQTLYQIADGADEFVGPSGGDNRFDDTVEIGLFVVVLWRFVQQFFYNVGKLSGKCLPHLGTGVFGRDRLTDADQLMQRDAVEVVQVVF